MIRSCCFDAFGSTLCIGGCSGSGVRVVDFPSTSAVSSSSPAASSLGAPAAAAGGGGGGARLHHHQEVKPVLVVIGDEIPDIRSVKLVARAGNTPLIVFVGSVRKAPIVSSSGTTVASDDRLQPIMDAVVDPQRSASVPPTKSAPDAGAQGGPYVDSDRCVHIYDLSSKVLLADLFFETAVVAMQVNSVRLVVLLERVTYIFQLPSLEQLSCIPTDEPLNRLGLGSLSQVHAVYENCFYAFPAQVSHRADAWCHGTAGDAASTLNLRAQEPSGLRLGDSTAATQGSSKGGLANTRGDIMLLDAIDMALISVIPAHREPLAAVELSANGTRLASCSVQGTNIKVWANPSCTLLYQLRRGNTTASVKVLSFNPTADMLVAASESGTIHLFYCGDHQGLLAGNHVSDVHDGTPSADTPHTPPPDVQARAARQGETGIRSFGRIYVPIGHSPGGAGRCRALCAFSEDSRVLRVVLETSDPTGAALQPRTSSSLVSSTKVILAQYRVEQKPRLLHEVVLGVR